MIMNLRFFNEEDNNPVNPHVEYAEAQAAAAQAAADEAKDNIENYKNALYEAKDELAGYQEAYEAAYDAINGEDGYKDAVDAARNDRNEQYVKIHGEIVEYDEDGNPVRAGGLVYDAKQIKEDLRAAEEAANAAVREANDAINAHESAVNVQNSFQSTVNDYHRAIHNAMNGSGNADEIDGLRTSLAQAQQDLAYWVQSQEYDLDALEQLRDQAISRAEDAVYVIEREGGLLDQLYEANQLLAEAVARLNELESDYHDAQVNLSTATDRLNDAINSLNDAKAAVFNAEKELAQAEAYAYHLQEVADVKEAHAQAVRDFAALPGRYDEDGNWVLGSYVDGEWVEREYIPGEFVGSDGNSGTHVFVYVDGRWEFVERTDDNARETNTYTYAPATGGSLGAYVQDADGNWIPRPEGFTPGCPGWTYERQTLGAVAVDAPGNNDSLAHTVSDDASRENAVNAIDGAQDWMFSGGPSSGSWNSQVHRFTQWCPDRNENLEFHVWIRREGGAYTQNDFGVDGHAHFFVAHNGHVMTQRIHQDYVGQINNWFSVSGFEQNVFLEVTGHINRTVGNATIGSINLNVEEVYIYNLVQVPGADRVTVEVGAYRETFAREDG
ncbi:MAG: hypothetical protein FWB74_08805, partial [Defluviitaleaceae bacterium]|nr:hypothetical protein [Defluviitaleaceae bacterium]